jgi:hypothetical protein
MRSGFFSKYRDLFEEAKLTNSIIFDDEISFGVCRIGNQGDSPELVMVCEESACIEYAHTFCVSSATIEVDEEIWWCDEHCVAKKCGHDELIA